MNAKVKPADSAPKNGDLRIFWIPQVPMKSFEYPVPDIKTAKLVLDMLANYDEFQLKNNIKPDYCNAGGLQVLEDGEWVDWTDEDGNDIKTTSHE